MFGDDIFIIFIKVDTIIFFYYSWENFIIYIYCSIHENANDSFSKGLILQRNQVKKDTIQWIYESAKNGISFETVLKTMKVA